MLEGETLAGLLAQYEEVAFRTDESVATIPLDLSHPLPEAPWFPPNSRRSARRVFLHIIAETAQHAGHADILRGDAGRSEDDGLRPICVTPSPAANWAAHRWIRAQALWGAEEAALGARIGSSGGREGSSVTLDSVRGPPRWVTIGS